MINPLSSSYAAALMAVPLRASPWELFSGADVRWFSASDADGICRGLAATVDPHASGQWLWRWRAWDRPYAAANAGARTDGFAYTKRDAMQAADDWLRDHGVHLGSVP